MLTTLLNLSPPFLFAFFYLNNYKSSFLIVLSISSTPSLYVLVRSLYILEFKVFLGYMVPLFPLARSILVPHPPLEFIPTLVWLREPLEVLSRVAIFVLEFKVLLMFVVIAVVFL